MLPEDRADLLYHRYDGGGITIDGPSVLVRKKFGESFSATANYYVDVISSASIDVVLDRQPVSRNGATEKSLSARLPARQDPPTRWATSTARKATTPPTRCRSASARTCSAT